ncbi:M14 family metallopeptidase [Nocardioides sp.]|uniref:M14 family metallopeptidase n=1 Tax=Nocardioides sp. TaxID=35761 RepID=UPI003D0A6F25
MAITTSHRPISRLRATALGAAALSVFLATALAGGAVGAVADERTESDLVGSDGDNVRVVFVHARTVAQRNQVIALGVDYTEHATAQGIEVILHSDADAQLLRDAGFTWDVKVRDLAARMAESRRADARYQAAVETSPLPSGRTSYRVYADYLSDLRLLAHRYPWLTKPITIGRSLLGEPIRGLEISQNADRVADGKPVFLMMGAHHAREWPSSEHTMEFAFDLLQGYAQGNRRARHVLAKERVIVVPIVNVDGFQISRDAATLGDFSLFDYEMKRKNCSVSVNTPAEYLGGTCDDNPAGRLRGTDLNRNYPGFWGGFGASTDWSDDTYRGDGPGDTPEVEAVRRLISERAVTVMITNHTYSNLVLRPPSLLSTGKAPDEVQYKALGDSMAQANQYASQAAYQLYDTSGSVEDWSYWNTGGYGFTFEIGPDDFHPEYADAVVGEYLGIAPAAGAGLGGNREAYYRAAAAAMDPAQHAQIVGRAPKGRFLSVRKSFVSETSPVIDEDLNEGEPLTYADTLTTRLVTSGGRFTMNVNPSTRPEVVGRYGRDPLAPPQAPLAITNPDGIPDPGVGELSEIEIQGLPEADNGFAQFSFSWPGAADWDFYVLDSTGAVVGQAASLDNPERVTIPDPVPGTYTVLADNYEGGSVEDDWTGEATFRGPEPATYTGIKEAWILTCRDSRGHVLAHQEVIVDRGARFYAGRVCSPSYIKRAASR